MKNTARKLLAFMLAAVLVLALNTVAFASEGATVPTEYPGNNKITIETTVKNAGTFTAYQVFSGKLALDEGKYVLSNIEWGSGVNGGDLLKALQADKTLGTYFVDCTTAADVAKVLSEHLEKDNDIAQAFADVVAANLKAGDDAKAATATAAENDASVTLDVGDPGYYFVKSEVTDGTVDGAETRYMLEVAGEPVNVKEKADIPSVEKKVKDANDTTDTAETKNDWQDSADYDIGDNVPFQLSATLPSNYNDYDSYTLTFHDDQSAGLTFKSSPITVKYVPETGDEITLTADDYTITTEGLTDGCDFEITIKNLKSKLASITDKEHPGKVVVEYTATLNENAAIGATGNTNDVYLEYSNNPNGGGTGTTPEDTVIVFTFELDVDKVQKSGEDGEGQDTFAPLKGAGFTLYKKSSTGEYVPLKFKEHKTEGESATTYYVVDPAGGISELKFDDMTTFPFAGLDDGEYKLSETTTPPGFNTIEDIEFTITGTHDEEAAEPTLSSVTFEATGTSAGKAEFNQKGTTIGIDQTQIVNQKGAQLPSTGGIGTTIFYVVGAILAVGAGILLIAKKRMQNHE